MSAWTVTRIELGLSSREISREEFADLSAAVASIVQRGVPLSSQHEAEIAAHPDTQFDVSEMLRPTEVGMNAAYLARVRYDLRPTESDLPPRPVLRCKCGMTGHAGAYPFSTLPESGRCDDCL